MTEKNEKQAEREAFETTFPMPPQCVWTGNGYAPTGYNAWSAGAYADTWKGWIARAALAQQPQGEEVELLAAATRFYNCTVAQPALRMSSTSKAIADEAEEAGKRLREAIEGARTIPSMAMTGEQKNALAMAIRLCENGGLNATGDHLRAILAQAAATIQESLTVAESPRDAQVYEEYASRPADGSHPDRFSPNRSALEHAWYAGLAYGRAAPEPSASAMCGDIAAGHFQFVGGRGWVEVQKQFAGKPGVVVLYHEKGWPAHQPSFEPDESDRSPLAKTYPRFQD